MIKISMQYFGGRGSSSGRKTINPDSVAYFATLTPDKQAEAITEAFKATVPHYLNENSDLQKLMYNQNMIGLPDVITDSELDQEEGIEMFRTVNSVQDNNSGVSLTAPEIAQQVMHGQQTYVASGSMAFHGEGIYFAGDRYDSENYGYTRGDVNKTCVIRAKIKPSAKIIKENDLNKRISKEIKSNSKLGQALAKSSDKRALYAVCKGYQVIFDGYDYYDIIDRSCLSISNTLTAKSDKKGWGL